MECIYGKEGYENRRVTLILASLTLLVLVLSLLRGPLPNPN
jgi:hypothetical protein